MLSTYTQNNILNGLVGRQNGSFAGTVYLGLSSTTPNEDGTGVTEPIGNGYARVLLGTYTQNATFKFGTPADGEISNSEILYFPESTGSWGAQLTHFVLFTAETEGQVLAYDELQNNGVASPITVSEANTVVMFREGALKIRYVD